MKVKLQNIVFPSTDVLESYPKLYYRGNACPLDMEKKILYLTNRQTYEFTTYWNGNSYDKWKKYTGLKGLSLKLKMEGSFSVNLVGHNMNDFTPIRKVFSRHHFELGAPEEIELVFPENEELRVGFEIVAEKDAVLYGGAYFGEYEEDALREVTLCIGTTTCKKEEYIRSNMALIRKEILEDEDDMKKHFFVHVVDNGRTLDAEKESSWHMTVHPNKNVGGSGGYARGMIEALHNEPKATHVLLMDDDIMLEPESVKRTYRLLTLLKPEYQDDMISGAMMLYERPNMQHEDIGTISENCTLFPLKGQMDQNKIFFNLRNEQDDYHYGACDHYAGWWYCCIPTHIIEKNGLPLPMFIRSDDVEYALRCRSNLLTMDGICVWHMGFVTKYNVAMDLYQKYRNLLIAQAVGSIHPRVDVTAAVQKEFRAEMLKFNYGAAAIMLKAFEDFMKGPDFIEQDLGEKILKENRDYNEKFVPLSELGEGIEWNMLMVEDQPPRRALDTLWYRITYNGHRFWPEKWLKDERSVVYFNDFYQPQKYVRRKEMYAVNTHMRVGTIRRIDKKKWKELKNEWARVWKSYKANRQTLEKSYRDKLGYLTSEEFWRQYLDL